jgi:hypothetical protein
MVTCATPIYKVLWCSFRKSIKFFSDAQGSSKISPGIRWFRCRCSLLDSSSRPATKVTLQGFQADLRYQHGRNARCAASQAHQARLCLGQHPAVLELEEAGTKLATRNQALDEGLSRPRFEVNRTPSAADFPFDWSLTYTARGLDLLQDFDLTVAW